MIARTQAQLVTAANRLRGSRVLSVDTETTGLDPHTDIIHSVQVSNEDGSFSVLIPRLNDGVRAPQLGPIMELLNSSKHLKVAHNAIFDVGMLITHYREFRPIRWFDTMIAERILTAGLYVPSGLADISRRYLDINRDKNIRTTFYDGTWDGFTWDEELIRYALEDVETLAHIAKIQMKKLRDEQLMDTAKLEMDLIPVWTAMQLRGIGYDPIGGKQFAEDMRAKARELMLELQSELHPFWLSIAQARYNSELEAWNAWNEEWSAIKEATGKRKGLTAEQIEHNKLRRAIHNQNRPKKPKPIECINLGSPLQLLPALQATGLAIESTKKEILEESAGANQYIDLLLEWRQYDKLAGTFGEPLLERINPVTNRIHPSFNPIVATGRCSCYRPNLQQIPQRTDNGKRLRKLFVAPKGRRLVVADYSGIELVIIAVMSGDETLMQAINENRDLHCFTISHAIRVPYEDVVAAKEGRQSIEQNERLKEGRTLFESIAQVPQLQQRSWDTPGMVLWVKDLRNFFKTVTYGTAYGLSEYGLSRRLHFDIDAARAIIRLFFETYAQTGDWLRSQGLLALERGYSLTASGRKRYFRHPAPVTVDRIYQRTEQLVKGYQKKGEIPPFGPALRQQARQELEREFNSRLNSIKRQGGNAPVQGTSADITKRAMLYVEQALIDAGFPSSDGLILPVHDELIAETDEERAELMKDIMKREMERAALEILSPIAKVNIVVEPVVSEYWEH